MSIVKGRRPWAAILFLFAVFLFLFYTLAVGVLTEKISVLLFRMQYGVATYQKHPIWYFFGCFEWLILSVIAARGIWVYWNKRS